ncbi:response regulator [Desulfitobacterium sp. THU1]|uniref:response regulator transcription factor n=1 Tax=Desulfitobacterium sp. THU1 TaxID=3138072 RepID=UPI00311F9EBD
MFEVMIVDDMDIMIKQIKRLTLWSDETDFRIVAQASDGQEALEKLREHPVDLLITDIEMPIINGIELLKEVQERGLASCVVFLSVHSEFNFAKHAIQYGVFDYLIKPVAHDDLKQVLEKAKKHLLDKKKANEYVKTLEEQLIEKVDIYYPEAQLRSLLKQLEQGEKGALRGIEMMLDEVCEGVGHDRIKGALVLQKIYDEVLMSIQEAYPWIEKYITVEHYLENPSPQKAELQVLKERFMEHVERLMDTLNRFVLRSERSALVKEVCLFCVEHIENEISLGKIAEAFYLTKNYVGDLFKQETGITVGEYITFIKIERAKRLIEKDSLKNYEIALLLGFSDAEYFGKLFKKSTGMPPMVYRAMKKGER